MANQLTDAELREAWQVYHECGSATAAALQIGIARSSLHNRLDQALVRLGPDVAKPHVGGRVKALEARVEDLPKRGKVRRYLITCAQNNTLLHPVWQDVLALADHYGADVMVSRYRYNKNAWDNGVLGKGDDLSEQDVWYAPELAPYLTDERTQLAPGLVFCGELNILPTAVRPLSGLERYTGRQSTIVPHPKVEMVSVASAKSEATKFMYSTGAVTQRNYIHRKEGFRAEHDHAYGCLMVEVNHLGHWFVRQVHTGFDGSLQDLDVIAHKGEVTDGHRVEAITWGDIHAARVDPEEYRIAFAEGGILDTLRPKVQFVHDILDFMARNHHERSDPHRRFELFTKGQESVHGELNGAAHLLNGMARKGVKTVVVNANHDRAMERWLREACYKGDPINAIAYLELQLAYYKALERQDDGFCLLEHALRERGVGKSIQFLREDEGFVICARAGGIECGEHGDRGPNGARPGASLARIARKRNDAHSHVAGIIDGRYTAGTMSSLDLRYNKGPSSWSHAHTVSYPNGARTILTTWQGGWRGG